MGINWGDVIGTAIGSAIQGASSVGAQYLASEDQKRIARDAARAQALELDRQRKDLEQQRKDAQRMQPVSRPGGSGAFAFDPGPAQMMQVANDPMGVIAGQIIDSNPRQNPFLT